ncbi:MAG: Clp protease ClpP [Muribaculaceae bacterium]|nr:Clp protease ClpP [Muribaculaceae bacterium]MCM1439344.1 Clp protease ClpP [Roseburia sp.]
MNKKFWKFQNAVGGSVELLLYGDIADSTWWGDEATPKQFAEDLAAAGTVSEITVRINSGGGDVFAAQAIGNQLEQHPATVTAKIDGLCASAATIVACHCNRVVAANDATYMVHPVKMGLYGYIDATQMQQYMDAIKALRENIVSLYAKKTGREKDEVAGWMDATSWWTAQQAKDNGFVDELVDEEATTVENRGGVLFVNSVSMGMDFSNAPKFVQDRMAAPPAAGGFVNKNPAEPGNVNKEEQEMVEIKTVDDLRGAYPELVGQIEQAAADRATNDERARIKDIEEMALPGSEELTAEAKFGKPMSAADYAKAAMKQAKEQGKDYLDGIAKDAAQSGANGVKTETPAGGGEGDEFLNAIRSQGKAPDKQ